MTDRTDLAAELAAGQAAPGPALPPLQPVRGPRHPDELAAAYTGSDPAEVARITAAMRGGELAEQQRQEVGGLHGLPGSLAVQVPARPTPPEVD
jgi:hypothetical protein